MRQKPSPNFNARSANVMLEYIVLHYTDMVSEEAALERLCNPESEVSAHYLIGEDGTITQMVDEKYRAWHAGQSYWRGLRDMNSASVGIELANPGHTHGYRPFPAAQIDALTTLIRVIVTRHHLDPLKCLLAHSDIAPARKDDPGELFPWHQLAKEGFGFWPEIVPLEDHIAQDDEVITLLEEIGYDTSEPAKTLYAFQRRYFPDHMDSDATPETVARLRAVAKFWRQR